MDFIEYINNWSKLEVTQGRVMIGVGVILLIALYGIFQSQIELLKGALIPLVFLVIILVGYGGYILSNRPAHAKESIALYQKSAKEAIVKERAKHINDNKAGKTLMKYVYPSLMLLSVVCLFTLASLYYKGMALGVILLSISAYIIDNGFVTRSDAFIAFLEKLK